MKLSYDFIEYDVSIGLLFTLDTGTNFFFAVWLITYCCNHFVGSKVSEKNQFCPPTFVLEMAILFCCLIRTAILHDTNMCEAAQDVESNDDKEIYNMISHPLHVGNHVTLGHGKRFTFNQIASGRNLRGREKTSLLGIAQIIYSVFTTQMSAIIIRIVLREMMRLNVDSFHVQQSVPVIIMQFSAKMQLCPIS